MEKVTPAAFSPASGPHLRRVARPCRATPPAVSSPQAHTPPPQGRRPPLQPGAVRKRKLEVDASTPTNPIPPPVHRLSTPECVSSPVSHLRNPTKKPNKGGSCFSLTESSQWFAPSNPTYDFTARPGCTNQLESNSLVLLTD